MAKSVGEAWRDIVKGYLASIHDDERARRELKRSNSQAEFLRTVATSDVHRDYAQTAKDRSDALLLPPDESELQIVEEQPDHLVVEIAVGEKGFSAVQVPFLATRLRLCRRDGNWRIADILERCSRCNLGSKQPGRCVYCSGSGETRPRIESSTPFDPQQLLKRVPCEDCGGTGKCRRCARGDTPGWTRSQLLGAVAE